MSFFKQRETDAPRSTHVPTYDEKLAEVPLSIPLISLTELERDAAREQIQRLHATAKVSHIKRLIRNAGRMLSQEEESELWRSQWSEPNSAQMIDEIIQTINNARVRRAEQSLCCGYERPWP